MKLLNKLKEKETWIGIGKGAAKIGKTIVWEGTKMTTLKVGKSVITTSFDKGMAGIKDMKLDDYLGIEEVEKKDKPKRRKLFSKKDKIEELIDEVAEEAVDEEVIHVEGELVD